MLNKVISVFLALVFLYFVMLYPERIVEVLQMFIDAAHRVAVALGNLSPEGK